jgi:hypothetical protein
MGVKRHDEKGYERKPNAINQGAISVPFLFGKYKARDKGGKERANVVAYPLIALRFAKTRSM